MEVFDWERDSTETARSERHIHLHCLTVLLFCGQLAMMTAHLPPRPSSYFPKICRDASL